jgi:hypothetical protein
MSPLSVPSVVATHEIVSRPQQSKVKAILTRSPRPACSVREDWRDGARLWQAVCWLREQLMSADGEKKWGQQC